MGESDRYLDYRFRKPSFGDDRNALTVLISINAIIFLAISFISIIYYVTQSAPGAFETEVLRWFLMPAKLGILAHRPWTLLTYMFTQTSVILAITNMLWLWVFGYIFQSIAGNSKLIPVYLYGGLAGALIFIIANYSIPPLRASLESEAMFGANAAIMAVAVATTTLAPDYRVFKMLNGGIPLWVITVLYVVVDFAGIATSGAAHHLAHLAGGFAGFMFVFSLRKGKDWSLWMNTLYEKGLNLFNPAKKQAPVRRMREKVFYKSGPHKPFVKSLNVTQQRIDEILDKINQKGYHLLTEEEKNILKKAGESDL